MVRRVGSLIAMILVAMVVLAACGSQDDEVKPTVTRMPAENAPAKPTPANTEAATSASPAATEAPATSGGAATAPASEAAGEAALPATFDIQLLDIKFNITELVVPANTEITLNVTNNGVMPHNFEIKELGADTGEIAAGQSKTITFKTGAPGEYQYICNIPGHKESGMVGKLIVK